MNRTSSIAAVLLLALASGPAAAAPRAGFIRFEGIAGDGGDAGHPGWFSSQFLEVAGLGSGASAGKGSGAGSVGLSGGGPGFDALVRACLSHRTFATAEVALGTATYVLEGVAVDGIHIYGAGVASGASAGKGPVSVSFRFTSLREPHAPKPEAATRLGNVGPLGVVPLLVAPTPTPPRSK
jgi:hypothetical protein